MEPKNMGFFEIKKKVSKKDFLRNTLVTLGLNKETPSDIFDAEFEEIVLENKHFVGVGGSAEVKCSASIGHDYYVDEKNYNDYLKKVETKSVRKTNWSPYQTTYFAEKAWGFAENTEKQGFLHFPSQVMTQENLISLSNLSPEKLQEKGIKEVEIIALEQAHRNMICDAEYQCEKKLPGDRHEHVTCETKDSIQWYINVILAHYSMNYQYAGQTYSAEQYVNGQSEPYGKLPQQTVEEKADKKVKFFRIASIVLSVLLVMLSVKFYINIMAALIILALSTGVFAAYEWFEISDRKKRTCGKWISKRKALVEMLAKKGLDPLKEQEEKEFDNIIKTAHKLKFGVMEAMPIVAYIISVFFLLFAYSSTLLVNLLVYIPIIGIAALVIYGAIIFLKNK